MPTTFADRLAAAIATSGKSRTDLAAILRSPKGKIGISSSAVGQLLDGKSKSMTAENCARASRFLNVDCFWLATGEGQMRERQLPKGTAQSLVASSAPAPYLMPAEVLDLLADLLRKVPLPMRTAFADALAAWARAGGAEGPEDRRMALLHMLTAPAQGAPGKLQNAG